MGSEIYALGSNQYGQLGISHYEDIDQLNRVHGLPSNRTVKCIKSGGNHTLVLLDDGLVYGAGDNRFGQLGKLKGCDKGFHELLSNIKLISAGFDHSVFIDKHNHIYACGSNAKGQVGGASSSSSSSSKQDPIWELDAPTMEQDKTILHLASGMYHNIIVYSDNSVYGWGYARNGQLGEELNGPIVINPQRINIQKKPIKSIACGRTFTVILFQDDNIQVLGGGKGNNQTLQPPSPYWSSPVRYLGATWNSIHVLTGDGHHEAWGSNNNGQLLTCDSKSLTFSQIAVGSAHVVGQTSNKQVVAWGWAKHGNCGEIRNINDMQSYVHPNNILDIAQNKIVTYLAAGSATTFIVVVEVKQVVDDNK